MDFKSKLATLTQPKAREQSASAGDAAEHSAGAPARSSTLLELREKMAEILQNPGLLPRPRAERSEPDFANFGMALPFVREERASGPLFRRHQLLAPSHHVGRMPVD